jgi:hypothetical protein
MARRFKTRSIKANKTYQVDELADAAGVSIPTVRNWIGAGMQRVDSNRPAIIMGFQALEFLNARKAKSKQPMALGEFYCLRCKVPRAPLGAMADYVATSVKGGRLKALCGVCECPCNRNISASDLPDIHKVLDVENRCKR